MADNEKCWEGDNTVSLPDLRTEDSTVLNMWKTWISQMISNYSIDGIRFDGAQQVDSAFFAPFQSAAGGMYILGEVYNGNPNYVCSYQNYVTGLFNFPT
jgi:alpha-amylase